MNIRNFIVYVGVMFISLGAMRFLFMNYSKTIQKGLRVAVFQPATHPALDEIAQAFIKMMREEGKQNFVCDVYNANGNKILMQAQAQDILHKKYDLVFTIGVGCSVTMKDLCSKKLNQTPLVFTAIDDPVKLDLEAPNMTGVIDTTNYQEQLSLLQSIKPSIKKVLLVYDQSQASGLEKDRQQIGSILKVRGIELVVAQILHMSEIQQKVMPFLATVDAVMVLKDNTVVSGIDSLINLCERYHIPLLASDLNSGEKGAALAYGIYEAQSGIAGARQALLILDGYKMPSQVPVIAVQDMVMKINCAHAAAQGLAIDCHSFSMPGVELNQQGATHA